MIDPLKFRVLLRNIEEVIAMAKITVEQAVAAIRAAGMNEDAIEAVLKQCTKRDMHVVFLCVTSNKDEIASNSMKKEELVDYYCGRIVAYQMFVSFKAMDGAAKAEYIANRRYEEHNNQLEEILRFCSLYELVVIASKLGVSIDKIESECKSGSWYEPASGLVYELRLEIPSRMNALEGIETVSKAAAPAIEVKMSSKDRAKANRFFRTMNNQQIAFALELYRKAMAWADTQDFSTKPYISTTRQKVEEWVSSLEAQEAYGLYSGWLDYLDHYSRMLNVKIKGHSSFDEPTNADEEDSLVQSISDRIAFIGPDPRAIEREKAYHEELKAARQAAMKKAEKYILSANGGLVEFTRELNRELLNTYRHNYDDEKAIRKAIAEYNCVVLSQYHTREELIAAIMQSTAETIAHTLYWLTGKQINNSGDVGIRDANKFADWYMTSEYYHPEQAAPAEARNTEQEQPQPEQPAVVEAPAPIVEQAQPKQPDSYEVGKQIVSLKGKAKAQQALVQECGEDFLLNMHRVFPTAAPIRVTMETPDELRKYVCRDVIRVARDADYARFLLKEAQNRLDRRYEFDNREYLEGWVKFLADYAAPEKELSVEERLSDLRQRIHDVCEKRAFHRSLMRELSGTEFEERYAESVKMYTEQGLELLKQYKELKRQVKKPAAVSLEQPEVPAVTYADVDAAYRRFDGEITRECIAGSLDFTLCNKLEREYLSLLAEYRQTDMPEGKEVLEFIRSNYEEDYRLATNPFLDLPEMATKCGLNGHSYHEARELAKDLCRMAGVPVLSDYSSWELYKRRKVLQTVLHERWQIRHAMKELKKLYQAGAISDKDYNVMYWSCDDKFNSAEVFFTLLEDYKETCRAYEEVNKRKMMRAG